MSATPGSDTLWSVHSGQYRVIRRFASSTMSWKRRSSRFGAGKLMPDPRFAAVRHKARWHPVHGSLADARSRRWLLVGDHIERVHQVAVVVGGPHVVVDLDADDRVVIRVGRRGHRVERDARLPPGQRLTDALLDQAERVRVDRREHLLPHRAAEVGAHDPLARRGGEDQPDRRVDLLATAEQLHAAPGGELNREAPPRADQVAVPHPTRTFCEPDAIEQVGASTGSLHVITGSPTRARGLPLTRTMGEPVTTLPWLVGGFWNVLGGGAMCGGTFCATLFWVAACSPLM